jgi:hypothetical protein
MCLPSAEGASDQRLNLYGMRWARRDERRFRRGIPFNEGYSRFQKVAKDFGMFQEIKRTGGLFRKFQVLPVFHSRNAADDAIPAAKTGSGT